MMNVIYKFLCFILLTLCSNIFVEDLQSQIFNTVAGKVIDRNTEEIIIGASVSIVGTELGGITDKKGRFRIENVQIGKNTLRVKIIGYNVSLTEFSIDSSNHSIFLVVPIDEKTFEAAETEVVTYREDTQNSHLTLGTSFLQSVAGALGDPVRALYAFPGIMPTGDYSSQLIVRGGGADQNLVLLENVEIFNPYRLFGTVSFFNPATLKNIDLFLGGFPARYGDRLSAVLDVKTREGTQNALFSLTADVSLIDANLTAEGAIAPLNGNWILSFRRTYLDLIIAPILRISPIPNFTEGQFKLVFNPFNNHRFEIFAFLSQDATRRDTEDVLGQGVRSKLDAGLNTVDYLGVATWKYTPNSSFGSMTVFSAYQTNATGRYDQQIANQNLSITGFQNYISYNQRSTLQKQGFLQRFYYNDNINNAELGLNFDLLDTRFGYERRDFFLIDSIRAVQQQAQFGTVRPSTLNAAQQYYRIGIYLQDKIRLSSLTIEPSIRLDYFELIKKAYLSPRLTARYELFDSYTFTAAVGFYRQSPGIEKWIDQNPALLRLDFNDPTNILDLSNRDVVSRLNAEAAIHYIAGIEKWVGAEWLIRFETYYKALSDVIVQSASVQEMPVPVLRVSQNPILSSSYDVIFQARTILSAIPTNEAEGRAFGFEMSLEKKRLTPSDKVSGILSYTFSRSERLRNGIVTLFSFDRPHNINFSLSYKPSREWEFSVTWRYASGLPYTPARNAVPVISFINGAYRVISDANNRAFFVPDFGDESNFNSARLPDYHRLDLRITYLRKWGDVNWQFYIDILNLYNRRNLIGFIPNTFNNSIVNAPQEMLPLIPSFGFNIQF